MHFDVRMDYRVTHHYEVRVEQQSVKNGGTALAKGVAILTTWWLRVRAASWMIRHIAQENLVDLDAGIRR
jgi:hypothetical protein